MEITATLERERSGWLCFPSTCRIENIVAFVHRVKSTSTPVVYWGGKWARPGQGRKQVSDTERERARGWFIVPGGNVAKHKVKPGNSNGLSVSIFSKD